jgi:hypothetical protein
MGQEKSYKQSKRTKKEKECVCTCSTEITTASGFEPDPANPGQFLWKLKKGSTGVVLVKGKTSGGTDDCTCSEDITADYTTAAPDQTAASFPGRLTSVVSADGSEVKVTATVVGLARLIVRIDKMTIECIEIGKPGTPNPNPTVSVSTPACGGTSQEVEVIP